jgi:hypothetical protein
MTLSSGRVEATAEQMVVRTAAHHSPGSGHALRLRNLSGQRTSPGTRSGSAI